MENEHKQTIIELSTLLKEQSLSEIEYESNGLYLRVVGANATQTTPMVQPIPAPVIQAPAEKEEKNDIVSPMVGVVYLAKDTESPAFVRVGDQVSVGQTVCLIEAMKTFNPIKSDKAGRITKILVENGSPVEYNQPLFTVE
mgnify:CR=1 FL=1